MTDYHLKPPQEPPEKPAWQIAKEKRRKQLAEVRRRRAVMYQLIRKMQLAR